MFTTTTGIVSTTAVVFIVYFTYTFTYNKLYMCICIEKVRNFSDDHCIQTLCSSPRYMGVKKRSHVFCKSTFSVLLTKHKHGLR